MDSPIIVDHILSWIVFLPLGMALFLLATGLLSSAIVGSRGLPGSTWRLIGFGTSLINFAFALSELWRRFDPQGDEFQLVEHVPWLEGFGVNYFVGIDGISFALVLLTTFLFPIALMASWNEPTRSLRSYVFFMLALETGVLGTFVSLNLFQFYLFWEITLVPMLFLIGVWGGPRRIYAAIKFFLFTMLGSLAMLVGMLVLVWLNFEQASASLGEAASWQFDLVVPSGGQGLALLDTQIPIGEGPWWQTQFWLFAAFALAFAIKVPIFPLHTWLPDAHVEAPTPASVLLAGLLLKLGAYGFIRIALPLFPAAASSEFFVLLFSILALIGIIYGSLVAMVQTDIKRLVAYSSIAHLGFVVLGTFALNTQGLSGGVLQMVNHGLSTGALFVLVGFLVERRHTREIAAFGGLVQSMPVYTAFFGLVMMSSIGLPGLNGFVGELLILLGSFAARPWVGAVAVLGVLLSAVSMLWMFRRVFLGPIEGEENTSLVDLSWRERLVMIALILPILWIGLYPNPLLQRIDKSTTAVLERMQSAGASIDMVEPWHGTLLPSEPVVPELEPGEAVDE